MVEVTTGVALLITGSVVALKEGPKIQKDIQDKKEETGKEKLNPVETVQATWKHVLPIVVTDAAGAFLVIDGYNTEHKRAMAFASAAGIAEETLRLTREKEESVVGERKSDDIQQAVAEDEAETIRRKQDTIYETGHGSQLFMDKITGITFRSDKEFLERKRVEFNDMLRRRQDIPLNEWYELIGINLPVMPAIAYAFGFSTRKDKYGRDLQAGYSGDEAYLVLRYRSVLLENGEHVTLISYDVKPNFDSYSDRDSVWDQINSYAY